MSERGKGLEPMKRCGASNTGHSTLPIAGWAGWLIGKLRSPGRTQARLRLVERISLAPRQSLALVEAEGRRFLVATSADGATAFYPLQGSGLRSDGSHPAGSSGPARPTAARVSW